VPGQDVIGEPADGLGIAARRKTGRERALRRLSELSGRVILRRAQS